MEDVLAVCGLAAGLGVDLGVGHAGRIAKKVLPHIGGGDQVGVLAALMAGQVAQNIRLAGGRAVRLSGRHSRRQESYPRSPYRLQSRPANILLPAAARPQGLSAGCSGLGIWLGWVAGGIWLAALRGARITGSGAWQPRPCLGRHGHGSYFSTSTPRQKATWFLTLRAAGLGSG